MKIYVVTKNDETVAVMDNEVSGALHFSDDEFHRYLDNGASTFDLTVAKKHRIYSNATDIEMEDFQYLVANNFLIFTYKNKDYKFTIRRVEETETSIRLFCEDLSFDLLNEYRGPYIADKAYNIAKYVNDCLYDSGYTIGINEFVKNTRTLKWEGDDTVLKRLLSICNSFDAELEFETQLNNDRTVNKQLVHLRKRVGLNRPDIELKYGREVSSIRRNVDLTELITAIKPRGHENDGKYVTIKNIAKEVKDADGNVAYFTKKGSEYLYAPMANQIYGSPEKKSGGYIVGQFSYDTESDTELYNRALTELQLKCMPAYEYEIEGFYDVDIGDTVRAIDEAYNPILMLEARISEQVISFTDPTRNKTVYSNYRVLNNLVSQSLLDRIDDVKDYAEQVARTYIFSLKNVGSSMFKNGIGEVTYTAKAEKNNKDVTSEFDSFNWTKQLKDGTPDEAWNAAHVDFGTTLTVTPDDFEDTATFSYVALKGEETFGGASSVVTKVYDGENGTPGETGPDGKTSYLHIKYSDDGGKTLTANNGETVGQWLGQYVDFTQADSTDVSKYAWSKIKGDTGDNGQTPVVHQAWSWSEDGTDRFTTIYPGENLIAGGWTFGGLSWASGAEYTANDRKRTNFFEVDGNTQYVFSLDGVLNSVNVFEYDANKTFIGTIEESPVWRNKITTKVDTKFFRLLKPNNVDLTEKLKCELGTSPTIYTPAPSEDYANAYPLYEGTYTDYSETASQNPADYTWRRIIGESGQDGATGPQGPQGITGPKGEDGKQYYTWLKYADSPTTGMSDSPTNKKYMGLAYNKTTATESTNYADYTWSLIQGPQGNQGIQGPAGANGQPTYTWIKYGTSASGAGLSDDPTGKTYIGMAYNKTTATESTNAADYTWSLIQGPKGDNGISVSSVTEEYYVSTSATEQTGGAWSTTVPNNANPNLYVWRRVKNTMSDGTVSYTTPALIQGMTGIYPYIGPTQPANPKEGQQWWKSDSNGNVTDFYVYHDGSWQGQTIQQSVLNIEALNAVNITGSSITGTTISGSTIRGGVISGAEIHSGLYSLEYKDDPLSLPGQEKILGKGVLLINNGTITDSCQAYKESDPTTTIYQSSMNLFHDKISFYKDAPAPSYARLKQTWVGYDGLYIRDDEKFADFGQKTLTYQDLMTLPTVGIPAASGWSQYSTSSSSDNYPSAARNGRTVQLTGAFKNSAVIAGGTTSTMGTLPEWARPSRLVNVIAQASYNNRFLLTIETNGDIKMSRHSASGPNLDVGVGSWLNIACTYAAADL